MALKTNISKLRLDKVISRKEAWSIALTRQQEDPGVESSNDTGCVCARPGTTEVTMELVRGRTRTKNHAREKDDVAGELLQNTRPQKLHRDAGGSSRVTLRSHY